MGFLNKLFGKKEDAQNNQQTPEIPKEIFVKDEDESMLKISNEPTVVTINEVYQFIRQDFETRGYQDALVNEDEKFKNEGIEMLKSELKILLTQAANYYNLELNNLSYHIESRSRAGLIDMVEQLNTRKQFIEGLQAQIHQLNKDLDNNEGMPMRMIYSYTRGFLKGLTAISDSEILNKKIL
ncbi:MAG: hypothetical protein N2662_08865 [Bacteroidales bacterium]|nr:hypothetical protein [Bacteroidales bacterium]